MKLKDEINYQDYQENNDSDLEEFIFIKQKLRNQAITRITDYKHPAVNFFQHKQINSKESEELRHELASLYKPKVQKVREGGYQNIDYDKVYKQQFIEMTLKNEIQEQNVIESISQMHEMAEILLNAPTFQDKNLYIYSKFEPGLAEQQQISKIFNQYQNAYKQGEFDKQHDAQQTIKKAKKYLRDQYP